MNGRRSSSGSSACLVQVARAALFTLLAPILATCNSPRSESAPPPLRSFLALERDFQGFRGWTAIDLPERGPQGITHVAGKRREYVNRRPPPGLSAFPVGTILVKELLSDAPEGHQIFAMVKRGGSSTSVGAPGWEWFELRERDDKSVGIVWRGLSAPDGESYGGDPLGTCSNCHQMAKKNDFVRATALALAAP
ncbi:MAG: hypothetical protein ABW133_25360 [Polyangiaceae bacterium]